MRHWLLGYLRQPDIPMTHESTLSKPPPSGEDTYSTAMVSAHRYMRWMVSPFKPYLHGNIVEIGIGHGSYYEVLAPCGAYWGVDIDERAVRAARDRYSNGRFICADILDPRFLAGALPDGADAIVSINVLEHVRDDGTAVTNLVHALKSGGVLMVNVPALPGLYNDLDLLAGHCRRYTVGGFRNLLSGLPMRILKLCYFNPVGGLGWWLNCFRHHDSLNSSAVNRQIAIFDKYVVPFSRILDPLTRQFFGQSLVCIARRI